MKPAPRFVGIGDNRVAGSVEWLTPPRIIAALGRFDLDQIYRAMRALEPPTPTEGK